MVLPDRGRGAAALLFALAACALSPGCAERSADPFPQDWLEQVEELSESLANDLLTFSVAARDRDRETLAAHVADVVELGTPFPTRPGEIETVERWIGRHDWRGDGSPPSTVTRDEFLEQLTRLLGHFGEIEDVRFKVKSAEFDPARPGLGEAHIKGFVIGRDAAGRREWLTTRMQADFERGAGEEERWRFRRLSVESMESKVAEVDLFSEVAAAAAVDAFFPPFGVGANSGFVAHGAATADVNGDGLLDLVATGVDRNYLYVNRGDGRFDDLSFDSMVGYAPPGSGPLFLDYDNDGDPDLFLAAVGKQMLLQNLWVEEGRIRFRDVSEAAGVDRPGVGFSAAAADVDGNGLTDIYVASYNRYGTVMPNSWAGATNGTPNLLFLNEGEGRFREAAAAWRVADPRWSYAVSFIDLDEDGDQDLYVANDFGENAFYRNDGDRFTETARQLGIVDPGFGMGVSFGDYDNDGDLDLHVTNMSSTAGQRILRRLYPEEGAEQELGKLAAGNSLYENLGDGRFEDVTEAAGGFQAGWAFGGGFFDLDNDGWEDLYTPNGFISGKSMKDT